MEDFLRWLRACGHCGTTIGPIDGFCAKCFEKILALVSDKVVSNKQFPVHSLLTWDDSHEIVGNLVRSLKGEFHRRSYSRLAVEVAKRANLKGKTIVIPPCKKSKHDHAWNFGTALAEISGAELLSPFKVESEVEQKHLNKLERSSLRFTLTKRVNASNILFVDDLITTGATARAAWKALGDPGGFCVWTVACRPLGIQL